MSKESTSFEINSNYVFMIVGVLIPMTLFIWVYQSGKKFLSQEIPLVDTVMQLRVDVTKAHSLIHEYAEGHEKIEYAAIMHLIRQIRINSQMLYDGYVQMDGLSAEVGRPEQLQRARDEMKNSLDRLTDYLIEHQGQLIALVEDDIVHDRHFFTAERATEQFDHKIHSQFTESLNRQPLIFATIIILWLVTLALMFRLLSHSRRAHAIAFDHGMKLAQALEHSGSAIMITDTKAIIEYVNAAFCSMSGYEPEDVIGKRTSILGSGEQSSAFYQQLWQVIGSGDVWHGELRNRKKDGAIYPVLMSIAPIFSQSNKITHYIASQEDLSDMVAMEERLHMSQKLETAGILAGGIAHDFNNALAAIKANAQLLELKAEDRTGVVQRASVIKEVCEMAAKHIRQLLSFVRKEKLKMGRVELNDCINGACEMATMCSADKVSIRVELAEEAIYVQWNEIQAQQIMINLINNALHAVAGEAEPSVHVSVSRLLSNNAFLERHPNMAKANYASIVVSDNGYGIAKDQLEKIFEVFYTTKRAGEGTGLGLSMAHSAIKKAGGLIEVASREGEGTEFRIYLPLLDS